MIVTVKKLWLGHASVRDYIVKKAIEKKEDLMIKLINGETKIYAHRDLRSYLYNTSKKEFKSAFTGDTYYLIDLPWGPTSY